MSAVQSTGARLEAFARNSDMRLLDGNRWVVLADSIPWGSLQAECDMRDRPAFRPLFAACLIQTQYRLSDDETIKQIQESPYLQYFCGLAGYCGTKPPISEPDLKRFRERLTDDKLDSIKKLIADSLG